MGLPDLEPLIDDSRVLRMARPHSILSVSLIFYRAWIPDLVSGNAMKDKVTKTGVLSIIKTDHSKEIRASHELGLSILTPSKAFGNHSLIQAGWCINISAQGLLKTEGKENI